MKSLLPLKAGRPASLEEILITRRPRLVALMAANNETGVIQPWQRRWRFAGNTEPCFIAMPRSGSENALRRAGGMRFSNG